MSAIINTIHPRNIRQVIRDIDTQAAKETEQKGGVQAQLGRVWVVLGIACLSLILVHYLKYDSRFYGFINQLESWFGVAHNHWRAAIYHHPFGELLVQVWWGFWHLLAFIILPMVVIKFWLKDSIKAYGWQKGEVAQHWLGYVLLAAPIMVFAIIASFGEAFPNFYPFYKYASRSWFDLIAWEAIYIMQFIAVEFFFRGFLVNGLRLPFGSLSIAVMSLPYLMLHFPKLWPEAFGAILFGFFLGILALQSRSIWGGVAVHVSIALTMDIAALIQTNRIPTSWWP